MQNGTYKTIAMYKELRGVEIPVDWRKYFFNNNARPLAKFTLQLNMLEIMETKDKSKTNKYGVMTDNICCLETRQHFLDAESLVQFGYRKNFKVGVKK